MALRISGGDWSSWADVAHQLVGERQNQEALDLRGQQLRDARVQQQTSQYLNYLGLQERKRQFDETMGMREEELGAKYYKDSLLAEQKAMDLQARMDAAAQKRGLDEAEQAVRYGAVLDSTSGEWRSINEDDELYEAHKEYLKNKRTKINENVELNRRIGVVDKKIRYSESQVNKLKQAKGLIFGNRPEAVAQRAKIDAEIEKLQGGIDEDRKIYNGLYAKFLQGYGGSQVQPDALPGITPDMIKAVQSFNQGVSDYFGSGNTEEATPESQPGYGRFGHTAPTESDAKLDKLYFEQQREQLRTGFYPKNPVRYRPANMAVEYASRVLKWDGPYSEKDMYRLQHPDVILPGSNEVGSLYWVRKKNIGRVKEELKKLLANGSIGDPAAAKMDFFKKHKGWLTNDPRK